MTETLFTTTNEAKIGVIFNSLRGDKNSMVGGDKELQDFLFQELFHVPRCTYAPIVQFNLHLDSQKKKEGVQRCS